MPEQYRLERELADLGLREADTSVPTRRVAVGERIVLDVKDTSYGGYEIVKVRWTIPGKCITAYAATRKQAAVTDLSSADLEAKKVAFRWVDAKKQREVRARVTYKAGSIQKDADIVAAVFDVHAPKLDWLRFTTRSVSLIKRGNLRAVGFGVAKAGQESVRWNWQMTLSAGHPGWIKDVQTVLENRQKTLRNSKTMARRNAAKKHAHVQLDQSLLEAGTEPTYSAKDHFPPIAFPTRVVGGKSLRDTATSDSPFTSLEPEDVTVMVDDRFKYFILYKPDTADAVWVPVAKAGWFWKAKAVRSGANWRFPTKEGKVTAKGVTSEFPEYEGNVGQNQWIELP